MFVLHVMVLLLTVAAMSEAVVVKRSKPVRETRCFYNSVWYKNGQRIPDPCNICVCSNGQAICTLRACLYDKPVRETRCFYNSVWYESGQPIPDPCNICVCSNGQAICTLRACLNDTLNVDNSGSTP
ncbi:unnamed protein product [Candidula unifasciata]|uniref:Pacifastin domain-containing protein n=1 Tax=Candidula unifasciata TaxID=100452 RepID=A0A8S4A305_9EUPU|nr:unnamed protein product [Candidula unifasciata]